jgi:outer membrane lipoprotein-sorting protein
MSLLADHPRLRWTVPTAAVALIGAGALVANQAATADPGLRPRTAVQLLVDVQRAQLSAISGTVVQTSDLGLPDLPGVGSGGGPGGGSSSLTSMVSGTHTWRLWYAGPQRARVALLGNLGESDVIRNGRDLWVWSSKDKKATHTTLPANVDTARPRLDASELPKTPQEAADLALSALEPTTTVTTSGSAVVAGRSAYELVLAPKSSGSLVAQVRVSVDAERHVPLRVQVYSTKAAKPAFEVGFTHVDFAKADAARFTFNPPPGTTVTESPLRPQSPTAKQQQGARDAAEAVRVVGTGWSSVAVAQLPADRATGGADAGQWEGVLAALPRVSGTWGSGRLLKGTLFSAVVTDDGRVAVGAVSPDRLYAALAAK